jgi:serine/threonine-protein kinase
MPAPGEQFGRYTVERQLDDSRAGLVYAARDTDLGRPVVLTLPGLDAALDERASRLAGRLQHPNISTIYALGASSSPAVSPFIARQYVDGESIGQRRRRRGVHPPVLDALRWLLDVCDALAFAHRAGVVHGHVNPETVIITSKQYAVVVDFGWPASWLSALGPREIRYLSPEFVRFAALTTLSDVYAVGALLYALLSGRDPVEGDEAAARRQIATALPTPLAQLVPTVDPRLAWIVQRAMSPDVGDRFASVGDLRALIAKAVDAMTIAEPMPSAPLPMPSAPPRMPRAPAPVPGPADWAPPAAVEEVRMSVYRPRAMQPARWQQLIAFLHAADRRPGADPREPAPSDRVDTLARQMLGRNRDSFDPLTSDGRLKVPQEGDITLTLSLPGVEILSPTRTFKWLEDVHFETYQIRAPGSLDGSTVRGTVTAYLGMVVLAEVTLAIGVSSGADGRDSPLEADTAAAYRRVFASYAHQDVEIVRQFERYARAFGDEYLRDVLSLRAGEVWSERLLALIDQADVFQLFWSRRSMHSPYVRQEWEYALALNRPAFVRPTYWEDPLPESPADGLPPEALKRLHFHQFPLVGQGARHSKPATAEPAPMRPRPAPSPPAPADVAPPSPPKPTSRPRYAPAPRFRFRVPGYAAVFLVAIVAGGLAVGYLFQSGGSSLPDSSPGRPPQASPGSTPEPAPDSSPGPPPQAPPGSTPDPAREFSREFESALLEASGADDSRRLDRLFRDPEVFLKSESGELRALRDQLANGWAPQSVRVTVLSRPDDTTATAEVRTTLVGPGPSTTVVLPVRLRFVGRWVISEVLPE